MGRSIQEASRASHNNRRIVPELIWPPSKHGRQRSSEIGIEESRSRYRRVLGTHIPGQITNKRLFQKFLPGQVEAEERHLVDKLYPLRVQQGPISRPSKATPSHLNLISEL